LLVASTFFLADPVSSFAETINLRSGYDESGNAPWPVSALDTNITQINVGSPFVGFGSAFAAGDFTAAQTGGVAVVVAPIAFAWIPTLPSDSLARWISVDSGYGGGSALYAVPFIVNTPTANISSASVSVEWAADDSLGDFAFGGPNPTGAYLNGVPLPSISVGGYAVATTGSDNTIAPLLTGGGATNWLYFYDRDAGGSPSGLIFSATIDVVPEPASGSLVMGLTMTLAWRTLRARRRRNCASVPRRDEAEPDVSNVAATL
jgi:hypothetical protein